MAEVQHPNANDATHAKKRKGFWSKLFGRSPKAPELDEKRAEQEQQHKGGLMNSFMDSARNVAVKEVEHVAEHEAEKKIEEMVKNNNNGSQSTDPTANMPDATTTSPSDALNASTSWAKNMVDNAKQKVQGLQQSLSS